MVLGTPDKDHWASHFWAAQQHTRQHEFLKAENALGYRWRSSTWFIVTTMTVALFSAVATTFYKLVFSKPRFTGGLYCTFMFGLLDTTFTATLPLHVRETFHWGGMVSGLMFACLQVPRMTLSPFVGWLKDCVGTQKPTVSAFAVLAPLLWFLGIAGSRHFSWASEGAADGGKSLYVLTVGLIGIQSTFLNGAGTLEATIAVHDVETDHPEVSGPNGGKSRALAIASIAWNFGTFVGPVLSGSLNDRFGYFAMTSVVAGLCVFSALVALVLLRQ